MTHEFVNSLPFHLNRVGSRLGELFQARLSDHAITVPMYRAMAVLRQMGPQTLTELSQLTAVELSTLSRLIGRLAKRGLVERERPQDNGRIIQIQLSPSGGELLARLMPIAIEYENLATQGLSDRETDELKRALKVIYRNLDSPFPGPGTTE